MRRREFIELVGAAAAAWPFTAYAQPSRGARLIGVLMGIGEDDPEARPRVDALQQGLQERGWHEGRNIHLEYRWTAGDLERTRRFAKEIVDLKPDLIVVHSTPAVNALRELNITTPMVFALIADPLGSGFAASLARPGGNMTGFMNVDAPMASKWLELIIEIVPKVKRVALIFNPNTSPYQSYLREFEVAAPKIGVQAVATPVADATELERAITALGQQPDSALFVVPDVFVQVHRTLIIRLAEQYRLPGVYPYRSSRPAAAYYRTDRYRRDLSTSGELCGPDFQGRTTGRPACAGSGVVQVDHQSEGRARDRAYYSGGVSAARRRGDRIAVPMSAIGRKRTSNALAMGGPNPSDGGSQT